MGSTASKKSDPPNDANAEALFQMGMRRLTGDRIEKSPVYAMKLFEQAIGVSGHVGAIVNLARLLVDGADGVPNDDGFAATLYERAIAEAGDVAAMSELALLLRTGGENVRRDVPNAVHLLQQAIDKEPKATYMTLLAKILLSDDVGALRDPVRAKDLLEAAIRLSTHAPAMHELAVLLSRGDLGVPREPERAQQCFNSARAQHVCSKKGVHSTSFSDLFIHAGEKYPHVVERELRAAKFKPQQCLFLVLGGAGRGKTATIRSLCGSNFVWEHLPTELVSLNRIAVVPGAHHLSIGEIEELTFNSESLVANLSRVKGASREHGMAAREPMPLEHDDGAPLSMARNVIEKSRMAFTAQPFPSSSHVAKVVCWDLVGQRDYMMVHALFAGPACVYGFVLNLERLQDLSTRAEEVRELGQWMQLVYRCLRDPASGMLIIIGTRKSTCGNLSSLWRMLVHALKSTISDAHYSAWFANDRVQFVAIENRTAQEDPTGSGLEFLEATVKRAADTIVSRRGEIPARLIAFLEELEKIEALYLTKADLTRLVDDFPAFSKDRQAREADVMDGLQYFRDMGRIVLLEVSDEDLYVFMSPTGILDFLRQISGPGALFRQRLGRRHLLMFREGLLTGEALAVLWEGHGETERQTMLEVLCRFDLLILLQAGESERNNLGGLAAVPAFVRSGVFENELPLRGLESELRVTTVFDDTLPLGLKGLFVAHLRQNVGRERDTRVKLRSNSVKVSLLSQGGARVGDIVVTFDNVYRRLIWTIRAKHPTRVMNTCLNALESFLNEQLHVALLQRRHIVEFELQRDVVRNAMFEGLGSGTLERLCENPELFPRSAEMPFDWFISHAGSEKKSVAFPVRDALTTGGLRCFLDEEDLRVSTQTNDEQLLAGMRGSRAAIFILSPDFVGRKWPMLELRTFLELFDNASKEGRKPPFLLPLFYRLQVEDCKDRSLPHRPEYYIRFIRNGFFNDKRQRECPTPLAMDALRRLSSFVGFRNDMGESVEEFVRRVADAILRSSREGPSLL